MESGTKVQTVSPMELCWGSSRNLILLPEADLFLYNVTRINSYGYKPFSQLKQNRNWTRLIWCYIYLYMCISWITLQVFNHLCGVVPFWRYWVLYPTLPRCTLRFLWTGHGWLRLSISWSRMPSAVTQDVSWEGLKVALPSLLLKEKIRTFLQWVYGV